MLELNLFFVFGLGFLIYRSAKFAIFIINPLGEEDIKWKTKPKLPNLSSIKSRRLKKKNLFDFLRGDRVDIEHSIKEVYPMNSIEDDMDDLDQESIPDIEINIEDNNLPRSQRSAYQNTSSPKQPTKHR